VKFRGRAPLRISFGGGGTDVPPYCWEEGGAVVNSTIDRYAYATFEPGGGSVVLESSDTGVRREYPAGARLPYDGELDLLKAGANVAGAAGGFRLTTYSQAPPGSGMGGSSSLAVAIIGAIQAHRGRVDRMEVAMLAYRAEREELGQRGGYQDQLAAAHGGFNYMEFSRSGISVTPLRLDRWVILELEAMSILLYTGRARLSSRIHEDVDRRNREDPGAGRAYRGELRRIAREMRSALERGDLGDFGELLREGWEAKRRMSPLISDSVVDRAYARAMELGAAGGKVLGAGGGGHLFLLADPERRGTIIRELEGMGLVSVPFSFETEGGLVTWRI
jgi:D-glycero-alpha-D-manno-heptose-7-phosphate kinase